MLMVFTSHLKELEGGVALFKNLITYSIYVKIKGNFLLKGGGVFTNIFSESCIFKWFNCSSQNRVKHDQTNFRPKIVHMLLNLIHTR